MDDFLFWLLCLAMGIGWYKHVRELQLKSAEQENQIRILKNQQNDLSSDLLENSDLLDALFSSMEEAVLRVDDQGRVLAANKLAQHLFNINPSLPLPQPLLIFFRNADWQQAFETALSNLPEGSPLSDMKLSNTILAPRLVPLEHGQALILCVDISERVAMEAKSKNLYTNLAHDLKTPLTSISGYARSLKIFGDDAEFRAEAATTIVQAADRVQQMIESLLTLESFANDQQQYQCEVQPTLMHVLEDMESMLEGVQVQVEWQCDASIVVSMDCLELERVLRNVIENAGYHAKRMQHLRMRFSLDQEGLCVIHIADDGEGVRDDALKHLTERFYRVSRERSMQEGHGLGLAIVKELVEARGGKVMLAHHRPQGLEVILHLPIIQVNSMASVAGDGDA